MSLTDSINSLKLEKNALILAHIYAPLEVQQIADFIGDSLELSRKAADPQDAHEIIVFCGVYFMGETAALLSPQKKVLMADLTAGCPMADMAPAEEVREWKKKYPEATVVCYINSSAAVKAESDICVTSANAVKIVQQLPAKQILFLPDSSLGAFVQKQVPEKEIVLWPGFCPTHHRILEQFVLRSKQEHPQALLLAHPENTETILKYAEYVGSTSQMQRYAKESTAKEFIIASEKGLVERLQYDLPEKRFYHVTPLATCPNMKKNTLEKVRDALEKEDTRIVVEPNTALKALAAIRGMLAIS
jgi:quinolinate synthase